MLSKEEICERIYAGFRSGIKKYKKISGEDFVGSRVPEYFFTVEIASKISTDREGSDIYISFERSKKAVFEKYSPAKGDMEDSAGKRFDMALFHKNGMAYTVIEIKRGISKKNVEKDIKKIESLILAKNSHIKYGFIFVYSMRGKIAFKNFDENIEVYFKNKRKINYDMYNEEKVNFTTENDERQVTGKLVRIFRGS